MSGAGHESRSGEKPSKRVAESSKTKPRACGPCRLRKLRCDLNTSSDIHDDRTCKQCFTRGEADKCSFIDVEKTSQDVSSAKDAMPQNSLGEAMDVPAYPAQAEVAALRCSVAELQDRVWRTEVQLAAASSGQVEDVGDGKSNNRIEEALEEMVALVTRKYTDLERENRRLSAQVQDLQQQMQAQTKLHEASPMSSQNGRPGHPRIIAEPLNDRNEAWNQQSRAMQFRLVSVQEPEPQQTNKRSAEHTTGKPAKRNCVSNACLPCKRRRKKCDGVTSGCAGCEIYGTKCVFDLSLDQRRIEPPLRRSNVANEVSHT